MRKAVLLLGFLFLGGLFWAGSAAAQVQDDNWSEPARLSTEVGNVLGAGGRLVADEYGNVHLFWAEDGHPGLRTIIQYARFDGDRWSEPVDVWVSAPDSTFGFLSNPIVDNAGNLHIAWTMSQSGPILYARANVHDAYSVQSWQRERPIDVPANRVELEVDAKGVLHMAYSNLEGREPGVYYMRSEDMGVNWTRPYWLEPDIPLNYTPARVIMLRDAVTDTLHLVWKYDETIDDTAIGKDIRHAYSTDGGDTWSHPFIIDEADEEIDELRAGGLVYAVHDDQVHVVWSGTSTTRREHRYSLDGGETWSKTFRVFGELNGSAGDTLLFDGGGNVQFLGQIRFPQGMWNIRWDGESWSEPELVYLIRQTAEDRHEGIHIHAINATVLAGNQLIAAFTNSPSDDQLVLYAMHRTFETVERRPFMPVPTTTPTPLPTPTPQPRTVLEPTPIPFQPFDANADFDPPTPAAGLWVSLIPSILLLGVALVAGVALKRYR